MNSLRATLSRRSLFVAIVLFTLVTLSITSLALANIPTQGVPGGRILPKGSAPNPGTQEQELGQHHCARSV